MYTEIFIENYNMIFIWRGETLNHVRVCLDII